MLETLTGPPDTVVCKPYVWRKLHLLSNNDDLGSILAAPFEQFYFSTTEIVLVLDSLFEVFSNNSDIV